MSETTRETLWKFLRRRLIWLCDGDHEDPRLLWIWQRCECGQWRRDELRSRALLGCVCGEINMRHCPRHGNG